MTDAPQQSHAFLVGGGIASLAAAAFLIRDGGFPGEHIHILLDMLRVKVRYDRLAWKMRPLSLAHECLCQRGYDALADLTVQYGVFGGGSLVAGDLVVVVPEPAAAASLILLGVRRRRR